MKRFRDIHLRAKARIWPCLSHVCRVRSTAGTNGVLRTLRNLGLERARLGGERAPRVGISSTVFGVRVEGTPAADVTMDAMQSQRTALFEVKGLKFSV